MAFLLTCIESVRKEYCRQVQLLSGEDIEMLLEVEVLGVLCRRRG